MNKTKIEWCDYTWNPVTGCLHGCKYCYARRIANRFAPAGLSEEDLHGCFSSDYTGTVFPHGFAPTFYFNRLDEPVKVKKPSRIFVVSMGDLFGEWVPLEWIKKVFKACEAAPWHTYIFLTKNPKRYRELQFTIPLPTSNKYWYGTSVNNSADFIPPCRAEELFRLKGCKRFLSIEPLLGEIFGISLTNIKCFEWVIIGAQTGPGAVKPKSEWIQSIIDEAKANNVPVFLKDNLGWPERIQEYPGVMSGAT